MLKRFLFFTALFLLHISAFCTSFQGFDKKEDSIIRQIERTDESFRILDLQFELGELYLESGEISKSDSVIAHISQKVNQYPSPENFRTNRILGKYYRLLGMYLIEKSEYQKAVETLEQAISVFKKMEEEDAEQKIIELKNSVGRVYIVSYQLSKAKKHYEELLSYLKTVKPSQIDSLELSTIYNNIGVIHFYEGNMDEAYRSYDMSRTYAIMSGYPENVNVGRALYNMGLVRDMKGLLVDALYFYKKALDIYKDIYGEYHQHIAEIYGAFGNIHLKRLELEKARYYFRKDLEISRQIYGDEHLEAAWGYENIGRVFQEEGKDSIAKEMFLKALNIRERVYQQPHMEISSLLLSLSQIEQDTKLSVQIAEKAYETEKKVSPNATFWKWEILLNLIEKNTEAGDYDKAEFYLKKAESVGNQIMPSLPHPLHVNTFIAGAKLFNKINKYSKSLDYTVNALQSSLRKGAKWSKKDIIKPGQIQYISEYLSAITFYTELVFEKAGDEDKIEELIQTSNIFKSVVDVIRVHQKRRTSDDFSLQHSILYKNFYEAALKTYVCLWTKTKDISYLNSAFEYAERIKNNHSMELLNGMDVHKISNLPETTLRKEYKLKKDILYYKTVADEGNEAQQKMASENLYRLFKEEQKFYSNLKKVHPEYYNAKYNFRPLSLKNVQSNLSGKEAVWLSVFIGKKEYLFVITDKKAEISILKEKAYEPVIRTLLEDGVSKFIVIPDFSVKWVNLEAFRYKNKYLIEHLSFIYNTSLNNYFRKNREKTLINRKVLAVAPVNFESFQLPPLKFSKKEADEIKRFFTVKTLLKQDATIQEFKKNLLSFGALHISSHISYNSENPLKSKLYLSSENGEEDGILYAHDIFGTPMRTHLVTLSACDSKGTGHELIGIYGFADAFSYNGCENILMTLWNVEDKTMYQITSSFYKYLSKGYSKEEAIRQAKIDFIHSSDKYKSDQFYWAGIILQGDSEDLKLATPVLSEYWWAIALLIFFGILGVRRLSW